LHADTPPRYLFCDTKKPEVQRYQMFFGHFKVESRVTSVAWASAIPHSFFLNLLFQTSLLDWICWKIKVKRCAKPPEWVSEGAKKHQKSVMQ
jgi:hypothetical protein